MHHKNLVPKRLLRQSYPKQITEKHLQNRILHLQNNAPAMYCRELARNRLTLRLTGGGGVENCQRAAKRSATLLLIVVFVVVVRVMIS